MGNGVQKNFEKGLDLLQKSAAQDYAHAQRNMGMIYYRGEDVKQDLAQAEEWFSLACDNGDAVSCELHEALIMTSDATIAALEASKQAESEATFDE